MKQLISLVLLFGTINNCYCQDTLLVKASKGFLFLSAYHYMYDYDGGHMRPTGFYDYFFPAENFDIKSLSDSNRNIIFKNGIRVDFFQGRRSLKKRAVPIPAIDTSYCYRYERFYVMEVKIDYKVADDNYPLLCLKPSLEMQISGGSEVRFEFIKKVMSISRIETTSTAKKK